MVVVRMPLAGSPGASCQLIPVAVPLEAGSRLLLAVLGTMWIAMVLRGPVPRVGLWSSRLRVTVFAGVLVPRSFCLRIFAFGGVPVGTPVVMG